MSKKDQAQRIYNDSVRKGWTRQQIIEEFMYRLQMTQAGASTYFYNCQKAAKPASSTGSTGSTGSTKADEMFRRAREEQMRREKAQAAADAADRARKSQQDFESFQRAYTNFFNQNFRKAAGSKEQAKPQPKVEIKAVHWTVLLGVSTNASKEEITKAYRAKAMDNHMNGNDQDKLKSLNIAKDEAMKRFK